MSVDVACAGPVCLDLTFEGLGELPLLGQERFAQALHATPGGTAIVAIGLARLGLRPALTAPLGSDLAGRMLRELLEAEGVVCAGGEIDRSAVTVVLPLGAERAFVSYEPPWESSRETIAGLDARAIVVGLDALDLAPAGTAVYAVLGDAQADRLAGRLPEEAAGVRALLANRSEARRLTGEASAEGAALALAETCGTVVVTCGAEGAVAACGGELVSQPAPRTDVLDTTGAGDLFTAAYIWADLAGLSLADRLRHAVVYASLSVRTATGARSAATLDELRQAVAELDPAIVHRQSAKES